MCEVVPDNGSVATDVPPREPFRSMHSDVNGIRTLALSMTGEDHLRHDGGCEDYFDVTRISDDVWAVAVADGMGSARHGNLGAKIAVESALNYITENIESDKPPQDICRQAFLTARESIGKEAGEHDDSHSIRDYAATLTLAVVFPDKVVCGLIGDSGIVLGIETDRDVSWVSPCPPQKGEYANCTNPITMENLEESIFVTEVEAKVRYLFAMSDGVLDLGVRLSDNMPSSGFFTPLAKVTRMDSGDDAITLLAKFLTSERVQEYCGDDKTLVVTEFTWHDEAR